MKSKKILTILLSLAIMFTFMPAMAFASHEAPDKGVWNDSYSSVDITSGGTTKTYTNITKTWSDGTGLVTAYVDWTGYEASTKGWDSTIDYFDLNTAAITGYNVVSYDTFSAKYNKDTKVLSDGFYGIELSKPEYVSGTNTNKYTFVQGTNNTRVRFFVEGFDPDKKYESQTVTVSALFVPARATQDWNVIEPTTAITKTVTVTAKDGVSTDMKFYVDEAKGTALKATESGVYDVTDRTYDGKSHTIVNNTVAGFTVEYAVLNRTTNKFEKVDAITFKDAGESNAIFGRAVITETATKKTATKYFGIQVDKASGRHIGFAFNEDSMKETNSANNVYAIPEDADPMSYVEPWDYIYKADQEEAMNYFADKYEVKVTPNKADSSIVTWTIVAKEGVDQTALAKKYATFLGNYDTDYTLKGDTGYGDEVNVKFTSAVNDKDDDISFEGQTSFTYSGKKTTKKGVLKAKKTITVKATADSGNAITYVATKTAGGKITVSKAGKITVKKGLKKGTYKVTVKAKTAAGNGYKAASEKQTYVIKIKK